MRLIDRIRGSLIGGACGDSLGYAVEFSSYEAIIKKYGTSGLTSYDRVNNIAIISDDTQMTLFTASGLLVGKVNKALICEDYVKYIYKSYLDWHYTQTFEGKRPNVSFLSGKKELFKVRAPGMTCLNSLESGKMGTIYNPINTSKGCGGVMRVSPISFYSYKEGLGSDFAGNLSALSSAITHGHSLGYIPSYMLGVLLYKICEDFSLLEAVSFALDKTKKKYENDKHINYFNELMTKAISLSQNDLTDIQNITSLGEGWVGEEALAISLYASLRYHDNFKKGLIASVNHSGDSDSTGAITGNILGAYLGMMKIDNEFKENLELFDLILEICDDLNSDEVDESKYRNLI